VAVRADCPSGGLGLPLGDFCDGRATAVGSSLDGAPALTGLQHGGDAGVARNIFDAAPVPALGLLLGLPFLRTELGPDQLCQKRDRLGWNAMQRAERFKAKSLDCLRAAQTAIDETAKASFLELALQWRELAEELRAKVGDGMRE
jgi:hypothetical protein